MGVRTCATRARSGTRSASAGAVKGPCQTRTLASFGGASLGEVGEHDADEQGDHDHDDQRRFADADYPVNLDLVDVENGEHRDQDGQDDERPGAGQLSSTATILTWLTVSRSLCWCRH